MNREAFRSKKKKKSNRKSYAIESVHAMPILCIKFIVGVTTFISVKSYFIFKFQAVNHHRRDTTRVFSTSATIYSKAMEENKASRCR